MTTIDSFRNGYAFLSNFYPSPVTYQGDLYPTVEHAFQAAKTHNPQERDKVRLAPTPTGAKRAGRRVDLRPDWEQVKLQVMASLLTQKFCDPTLADLLALTGDQELVEGNTWGDRFWGVCKGTGHNHLGRLLMEVRAELRRPA